MAVETKSVKTDYVRKSSERLDGRIDNEVGDVLLADNGKEYVCVSKIPLENPKLCIFQQREGGKFYSFMSHLYRDVTQKKLPLNFPREVSKLQELANKRDKTNPGRQADLVSFKGKSALASWPILLESKTLSSKKPGKNSALQLMYPRIVEVHKKYLVGVNLSETVLIRVLSSGVEKELAIQEHLGNYRVGIKNILDCLGENALSYQKAVVERCQEDIVSTKNEEIKSQTQAEADTFVFWPALQKTLHVMFEEEGFGTAALREKWCCFQELLFPANDPSKFLEIESIDLDTRKITHISEVPILLKQEKAMVSLSSRGDQQDCAEAKSKQGSKRKEKSPVYLTMLAETTNTLTTFGAHPKKRACLSSTAGLPNKPAAGNEQPDGNIPSRSSLLSPVMQPDEITHFFRWGAFLAASEVLQHSGVPPYKLVNFLVFSRLPPENDPHLSQWMAFLAASIMLKESGFNSSQLTAFLTSSIRPQSSVSHPYSLRMPLLSSTRMHGSLFKLPLVGATANPEETIQKEDVANISI